MRSTLKCISGNLLGDEVFVVVAVAFVHAPIPLPHLQALNDGVSVFALIVDHFNVIQVSISPVNQTVDQVQGDAMRENNLTVHQLSAVLTIHVAALNPRRRPIVCEEYFTVAEGEEE